MSAKHPRIPRRRPPLATALAAVALMALATSIGLIGPPAAAQDRAKLPPVEEHPGYVDLDAFVRLGGGDDAVRTEVQIYDAALRIVGRLDNPVGKIARGLRGVRAVILEVETPDRRERTRKALRTKERELRAVGWERLAVVRDEGEEVHVLVREQGVEIVGLVVMIVSEDSGEVVLTNIVGTIDLDALQQFGAETNIPGLDQIGGEVDR